MAWGNLGECFDPNIELTPVELDTQNQTIAWLVWNNVTIIQTTNGELFKCKNATFQKVTLQSTLVAKIEKIAPIGDKGIYIRVVNKQHYLVGVDASLVNILDVQPILGPDEKAKDSIDGVLKPAIYEPYFSLKDIKRMMIWYVAGAYQVVVIMHTGKTFTISTKGVITPFKNVKPDQSNLNVLVTESQSIVMAQYGELIEFSLPTPFTRVLTITRTTNGAIAVLATCSQYYTGTDCNVPICFGVTAGVTNVCRGRGKCIAPDTCACEISYQGATCDIRDCNAINIMFSGPNCDQLSVVGYVVFGILGLFLLLGIAIIVLILILCTARYRRAVKNQERAETELQEMLQTSLLRNDQLQEQVKREWVIPFSEIKLTERVAEGSFGVVMKGRYNNADVAVKVLKSNVDDQDELIESFEHEVSILKSLRHPNIVLFMGVALNGTNRFIVTEFMHGKSLDTIIHKSSRKTLKSLHNNILFTRKLELLLDVVKGMLYLHNLTPQIVHRDLKPSVCEQLSILHFRIFY
jgi:hypothetical protein